jgi:hypothetical protein
MAKQPDRFEAPHAAFIGQQHIFFTASATGLAAAAKPALTD